MKREPIKIMKIEIVDRHFDDPAYPNIVTSENRGLVHKGEFKNIELNEEITESDFERALDTIYTFMANKEINNVDINLKIRDISLRPDRQMTIDEISEELNANITVIGHKIPNEPQKIEDSDIDDCPVEE